MHRKREPMPKELADRPKAKRQRHVAARSAGRMLAGEKTIITLHFVVRDEEGGVLDDMYEKTPFKFVYGQGDLPPGMEEAIRGLAAGETKTIVVPPQRAYGERDRELVLRVNRRELPSEDCVVGTRYRRLNEDGESELYTVMGCLGDWAYLDRNHPWAGRQLEYRIRIVEVLPVYTEVHAEGEETLG